MDKGMSIRDMAGVVKRRFWLILAVASIITLLASAASYYLVKPTYEASEYLLIGDLPNGTNAVTYEEVQKIPQILASSVDFIQSPVVLTEAAKRTGIKRDELKSMLMVENNANSQLITLKITGEDPQKAKQTAQILASTTIEKMKTVLKFTQVKLLEKQNDVTEKYSQVLVLIIGVISGIIAGIAAAFFKEQFDTSIRSEELVEKLLDAPVLGKIEMREIRPERRLKKMLERRGSVNVQSE